jgi:hypothetical protein
MVIAHLRSPQHPAVQAWGQLCSKTVEPNFIEILQEDRNCVYRIDGVGPSGTAVIAKRCMRRHAQLEQTIYQYILPHLPISSLVFYGRVDEPGTEFCWLFLEDAGGEAFMYSIDKHRVLATRWLGRMHVSAARVPAVSCLPDHGPKRYLDHLRVTLEIIQSGLDNSSLEPRHSRVLEAILSQGHLLESQWGRVNELCDRFPRTLVHGDFMKSNVRVRSSTCGVNVVGFDWERAGYGIPAFDIAETSGRGVTRDRIETDLLDYWFVVRESWWDLNLTAIKELADLGAVFRLLAAIRWESESGRRGKWQMRYLQDYQIGLAVALRHLGLGQQKFCTF